ncbi:MAG TPA: hypothetical protein VLH77_04975 [Gammaproteobacteria bacterium]|nr:hypothetical protein [Gammaproteobacteria bacterium]
MLSRNNRSLPNEKITKAIGEKLGVQFKRQHSEKSLVLWRPTAWNKRNHGKRFILVLADETSHEVFFDKNLGFISGDQFRKYQALPLGMKIYADLEQAFSLQDVIDAKIHVPLDLDDLVDPILYNAKISQELGLPFKVMLEHHMPRNASTRRPLWLKPKEWVSRNHGKRFKVHLKNGAVYPLYFDRCFGFILSEDYQKVQEKRRRRRKLIRPKKLPFSLQDSFHAIIRTDSNDCNSADLSQELWTIRLGKLLAIELYLGPSSAEWKAKAPNENWPSENDGKNFALVNPDTPSPLTLLFSRTRGFSRVFATGRQNDTLNYDDIKNSFFLLPSLPTKPQAEELLSPPLGITYLGVDTLFSPRSPSSLSFEEETTLNNTPSTEMEDDKNYFLPFGTNRL